jgi:predicted RNA-binding protein with PIN domain
VLVDGENVRRSAWPNISAEKLVERCRSWAAETGSRAVIVFDGGRPEERDVDDRCTVAHTGAETADDWLERRAAELAAEAHPYWLVTSDRALREAAGRQAERTIGGGSFLRELTA